MDRIVFMGTPEFAVPSLDRMVEEGLVPCAVVTGPDRQRGRGRRVSETPVKAAARRLGIPVVLQPESVKSPDFARIIERLEADVIVVVAFRILPPEVFGAARLGAFNLHGSLLPRYRGAAPIQRAVMAGEKETGVTTFFLKERVDTGQIILSRSMPIGPDETSGEVHDRMMMLGAEVVVETLRSILDGSAAAREQDDTLATPAPKIFRDECRVDWRRKQQELHNFIRGLSPHPGAWSKRGDLEIKLFVSRLVEVSGASCEPGTLRVDGERLFVACSDGWIELSELQQEGRRRMGSADFLRGTTIEPGERLS